MEKLVSYDYTIQDIGKLRVRVNQYVQNKFLRNLWISAD